MSCDTGLIVIFSSIMEALCRSLVLVFFLVFPVVVLMLLLLVIHFNWVMTSRAFISISC